MLWTVLDAVRKVCSGSGERDRRAAVTSTWRMGEDPWITMLELGLEKGVGIEPVEWGPWAKMLHPEGGPLV